ncbi:MAG: gliding motility protein GldM [Bacteroidetes bacterium]|nr:MAG: gliding motility protein GldM [Bacteroidota bacterium]
MAGGKETPRQKLIGLMYLVLLALLALQVSSAIMEKFKFLDDSLQYANDENDKNNAEIKQIIAKTVADNGSKSSDLVVLKKAEEVVKEAHEIKSYIDKTRDELVTKTGGYEEGGEMWKGAKEETLVEVLMIGAEGKKNGKAYEFQKKINGFVDYLNNLKLKEGEGESGKLKVFTPIALDAKDDNRISKRSEQKRKDFAALNFGQTPMCASMAVMSMMESEVLKYESDALSLLAAELGASDIKFDQVFAMYRADSRVVAAGTKYMAEVFLAASSSALKPVVKVDGRQLQVDKDGRGKLEFVATGGAYDKDGLAKKTWSGAVTFKNRGRDTTFMVKGEYVVAKPVIQVQSGAVSALYMNCGNPLQINVPALGSVYNPTFQASGAATQNGSQKGEIFVIPNAKNVSIKVSSSGNYIGDVNFPVKPVPKPDISILTGGKPVDLKNGVKAPGPRQLQIKAIPLADFLASNPKDARYKVTKWSAYLLRGSRLVKQMDATSELIDLSSFASLALPNDRITIEIKEILRTNFYDKTEGVTISQTIYTVPII